VKRFWIDIETRSRCDLVKHGVYRYAADPSTEILIICFALDDGLIKTWHRGQALPPLLGGILAKPPRDVQLIAHNASFERHVLGRTFRAVLDPRHWYCTATQARASALAGSLDSASRMLGTKLSKNRRGAELIRLLSMPQADGSFNDDPVLLAEFAGYCRDDVAVMRELSKGLPPLTDEARALYTANELINDRGLPIDTELCTAALGYAERAAVADQAFLAQHSQRLADREAGDVEFGGEVALHQPGAGNVVPFKDPVAEGVPDSLPEGAFLVLGFFCGKHGAPFRVLYGTAFPASGTGVSWPSLDREPLVVVQGQHGCAHDDRGSHEVQQRPGV